VLNKVLERFKENIHIAQFDTIRVSLASPEQINSLSYGEVKKTETINYRTLKAERDGLFCPKIFGPVQDWSCICGKYKRMKHRGIVCEKCGVEVIEARVRRERMGHIELVAPVTHIWYLRGTPSYLGLILDISVKDLEKVVYFEAYIVLRQGKSPFAIKTILSQNEVRAYKEKASGDLDFKIGIGAESIKELLEKIDIDAEIILIESEIKKTTSITLKSRLTRRMKVLLGIKSANLRPEWTVITSLPVLPPELRPLVQLEGGRFASSDLNELYRRVINRNIRLKKLIEIQAPYVIIKNEKRMLQESVDALIDNGKRGHPIRMNKRPLKSLSEMLRGKHGRFRQNLLGKRVDYSARSVIVVDPTLKINQFGIPKLMALELFKSHVVCELIRRDVAVNIRVAREVVESMDPVVWDILEDIVKNYPILLNRAPTLHRLGIQAFYPILIDTKALKIHPLVTTAFNADFDGDQMGVYIPLGEKAISEANKLVISSANLLSPQNGRPVMVPTQEMVLGLYYLSKNRKNLNGEGIIFSSIDEVITSFECGMVHVHTIIKLFFDKKIIETSVGRVLIYNVLPEGAPFDWINKILNRGDLAKLVEDVFTNFGNEKTIIMLDKIKKLGFDFSTKSGISFSYGHLITPDKREELLSNSEIESLNIDKMYIDGKITEKERYNKLLQLWDTTTSSIASNMMQNLEKDDMEAFENKKKENKELNFLYVCLNSKSRGSADQIKQLIGMRGLMSKPSGEIMETPVKSNFKNGLTVFEYFTSTHGARKGQADTALKTANAGYLTRRLVDVAQDVIVTVFDCKTDEGLYFEDLSNEDNVVIPLAQRIYGKIVMEDVFDLITNEKVIEAGTLITKKLVVELENAFIKKVKVRSVVKCIVKRGVCACCYGMDLSKNEIVKIGTAVGIIAAQSIGEPGTQLTMRTFHIGGTANLAERSNIRAKNDGIVKIDNLKTIKNREGKNLIVSRKSVLRVLSVDGREIQKNNLEYGMILYVKDNQKIKKSDLIAEWDTSNIPIIAEASGKAVYSDIIQNVTVQNRYDESTNKLTTVVLDQRVDKYQPYIVISDENRLEVKDLIYYLPSGSIICVKDGEFVEEGDIIAKIPAESSKTKDITGGLPQIAELFEARSTKDPAVLAEMDGVVSIGSVVRGMHKIKLSNGEKSVECLIPRSKQLNVNDGEFVNKGDVIANGAYSLKNLLAIKGIDFVQTYLVNQLQLVYKSQGVSINDRHFELIVKQMTRKVKIVDSGDTSFLIGDKVDKVQIIYINNSLISEGKRPAIYVTELTGITIASLGTESFVSAASFQETTRILSEAAIFGQVDHLYGPKENVIIGRLIPAGEGFDNENKSII
jgi:DNA-directed RNA polymerase subunit beta'